MLRSKQEAQGALLSEFSINDHLHFSHGATIS